MDPVCVVPWRAVPRWSWVAAGGSGVSVHRVKCPPELTLRWWAGGGGGAAPAGLPCSATHRSSDTCLSQGDTGSWEQTNTSTSTSLTQHPHTRATSPSPMPDILNILLQHYYYIWNNTTISLSVLYVVRWTRTLVLVVTWWRWCDAATSVLTPAVPPPASPHTRPTGHFTLELLTLCHWDSIIWVWTFHYCRYLLISKCYFLQSIIAQLEFQNIYFKAAYYFVTLTN